MRNALAHEGQKRAARRLGLHRHGFRSRHDAEAAKNQWRKVADQLRPTLPRLAAFMAEAEAEAGVLAYMTFPKDHWQKITSTNGLERVNGEVKRRTEVVGIFPPPAIPSRFARRNLWPASPNEDAITRLVGAILLEQNDEWAVQRSRYMTLETIAPLSDNPIVRLSAVTA